LAVRYNFVSRSPHSRGWKSVCRDSFIPGSTGQLLPSQWLRRFSLGLLSDTASGAVGTERHPALQIGAQRLIQIFLDELLVDTADCKVHEFRFGEWSGEVHINVENRDRHAPSENGVGFVYKGSFADARIARNQGVQCAQRSR
jgi:hypothetical protein